MNESIKLGKLYCIYANIKRLFLNNILFLIIIEFPAFNGSVTSKIQLVPPIFKVAGDQMNPYLFIFKAVRDQMNSCLAIFTVAGDQMNS